LPEESRSNPDEQNHEEREQRELENAFPARAHQAARGRLWLALADQAADCWQMTERFPLIFLFNSIEDLQFWIMDFLAGSNTNVFN
jgi:hypothetical protein